MFLISKASSLHALLAEKRSQYSPLQDWVTAKAVKTYHIFYSAFPWQFCLCLCIHLLVCFSQHVKCFEYLVSPNLSHFFVNSFTFYSSFTAACQIRHVVQSSPFFSRFTCMVFGSVKLLGAWSLICLGSRLQRGCK